MKKKSIAILLTCFMLALFFPVSMKETIATQTITMQGKQVAAASLGNIPLSSLKGVWKKGTMTISKVEIPKDIRSKALKEKGKKSTAQGCDFDTIKQLDALKGKVMKSYLGIFPIDNKSGYMEMTTESNGKMSMPKEPTGEDKKKANKFNYSNSTISIKKTQDGMALALELKATKSAGGYKIEGTYTVTAEKGRAKVIMTLSYTK
jgi:hypothetical protein